jgi:hypothetical protein
MKTPEELAEEYAKSQGDPWGFITAFLAGYQTALDSEKPDGWVSVKERLPEKGVWVLRYSDSRGVGIDRLDRLDYDGLPFFYGDEEYECDDATHWMPLPAPPEEDR